MTKLQNFTDYDKFRSVLAARFPQASCTEGESVDSWYFAGDLEPVAQWNRELNEGRVAYSRQ